MMELAVKLAAYLGLRRSEITGLRWRCVDLHAKVIVIQEMRTEVGGREVVKLPKTNRSPPGTQFHCHHQQHLHAPV